MGSPVRCGAPSRVAFRGEKVTDAPGIRPPMTRPLNGYVIVLASALLLGTLGVFSKLFYDAGGEPFTLLVLRFAAGGPLLDPVALPVGSGGRRAAG